MTSVKIFKPSKTAMSSGRSKTKKWVMLFERQRAQYTEPIMQWTGSTSTLPQVKLSFNTMEEAVEYAKKHHWDYKVLPHHERKIKPKSYVNNFTRPIIE